MIAQLPIRTVAPAVALMTTAEAKQQCRVSHSGEDATFTALIAAVMATLDGPNGLCSRALINQTWVDAFSAFPSGGWPLPIGVETATTITHVKYYAVDETSLTTLDASLYWRVLTTRGVELQLAAGASWPATAERPDAVQVTYVAGFGATADDVPANIKHAALLLIGHLYENREASVVGQGLDARELPFGVKALLGPWLRTPG